ncbi:UvrD-helicase domain-containing protein [Gilvimarinus xylanilyticus]|uniref:DNA 3'-5' helicase n=1 Tax=Gilvimarinus xylanilyticus TaxID=2944139 RepID=A0A9X2I2N2_9GAMM|nr:UvrD-helicase domain-containing protein [Gilvimarinus xylanilyticus]MCP8898387.1 UvrD-helicase domain-containing protein [Gilvimarinus xylanilyticus]
MSERPQDFQARERALDPTESFAVSAPAGSGKTGLLTHRVLKLLCTVESPEQVLAITFTNKAASEMRERIVGALSQAAYSAEPAQEHERALWQTSRTLLEHDKKHNWQLLKNPNRLRVLTIDGLCRAIAAQLPFQSGLGELPDTLEFPDTTYRDAATRLLQKTGEDSETGAALATLCRHMDNRLESLTELFVRLLAKREQWLGLILAASGDNTRPYLESVLSSVIEDHLTSLRQQLQPVASDLALLLDQAGHHLQQESVDSQFTVFAGARELPQAKARDLSQWQALAEFMLTRGDSFRKQLNKNQGVPAGAPGKEQKARFKFITEQLEQVAPEIVETLAEVRSLPAPYYQDDEWHILQCLTILLPRLAAELWLCFAEQGATDFTAITLAALDALGEDDEPSEIALKLDYQIKHLLVDEFQDTSQPQLTLLEKLTAGWEPDDGRTVFIVGDGMQSCYGFRNANVGLFLKARREGIGSVPLTPLDLNVNFRSRAGVVDWVNQVFADAFPQQDDISRGAVSYSPSNAFKAAAPNQAVQVKVFAYDEAQEQTREHAQQTEARAIIDLVRHALRQDPEGSIAVLGRNRGHLSLVIDALNREGIAFQAQDMDSLASRMVIIDLLTLTRALLCPDDRSAWIALLRCPWVGLDLHDLTALLGEPPDEASFTDHQGYAFVWQRLFEPEARQGLSAPGRAILERCATILQQALELRQRKRLRDWVYGTWVALGGPAGLLDQDDHLVAMQFFDLLDKHDQAQDVDDWTALEQAIGKLYAVSQNVDARVHVMTMHKSKGLEFNTVIIPGLDRHSRGDSKELFLWRERLSSDGEPQLLLGPLSPEGQNPGPIYHYLRSEQKKQTAFEATRLLYVGCTRAIDTLYLTGCVKREDEQPADALKPGGQLSSLWPLVGDQAEIIPAHTLSSQLSNTVLHQPLRRLSPQWQAPPANDNPRLAALRGHEYADDEANIPVAETPQVRLARLSGTVTHRLLEQLATRALPQDTRAYIDAQQALWRQLLRREGVSPTQEIQALARVSEAVSACLNSDKGRWVLDWQHSDAAVESAYLRADGERYRRQVIDRTFIADGERWIIDYKTALAEPGDDLAKAAQELMDEHRAQLLGYAALFAHGDIPVRLAIYCPGLAPPYDFLEIQ